MVLCMHVHVQVLALIQVGFHHYNYYCEAGFNGYYHQRTVWGDPLWNGNVCFVGNVVTAMDGSITHTHTHTHTYL